MPTGAPAEKTRTAPTLLVAMSAIASYTVAPRATEQISCPLCIRTEAMDADVIDLFLPFAVLPEMRPKRRAIYFRGPFCASCTGGSFGFGSSKAIWNRTDHGG